MKVYNQQVIHLTTELSEQLALFRSKRNFQPDLYLQAKAKVINEYFKNSGLNVAVVGVSGGIDSAVVLGLLNWARQQPGSPIVEIIPLLLPLTKSPGATNQSAATHRGQGLCQALGLKPQTIDLSSVEAAMREQVEPAVKILGEPWAIGQLVSYLRTPALYYVTALCSQKGQKAVVCGTTNQDEGAYLGYFGKASDGLVDVQIISDLHKSEVYQMAQQLQLPDEIIKVVPSGDMYDGRVDEEVFGTSYDFVELYENWLRLNDYQKKYFWESLDENSQQIFNQGQAALVKLHNYNLHKYLGSSPAVHLDVLEGNVPQGWKNNRSINYVKSQPSAQMVNLVEFPPALLNKMVKKTPATTMSGQGSLQYFNQILTKQECTELVALINTHKLVPTGKDGYTNSYQTGREASSWRLSVFNQSLADILWWRIKEFIPAIRIMQPHDKTDFYPHEVWTPVGLSPLIRFIKYLEGGELIPHYDAPFAYSDTQKTLMSVVIYLTTNKSGATRIIIDPQDRKPFAQRSFQDWLRPASNQEVEQSFLPQEGSGIIFDHRTLHDAEAVAPGEVKIILRTDIVFVKGGL